MPVNVKSKQSFVVSILCKVSHSRLQDILSSKRLTRINEPNPFVNGSYKGQGQNLGVINTMLLQSEQILGSINDHKNMYFSLYPQVRVKKLL